MKGTVDAKKFYRALDMVSRVPQKSQNAILEMVHIQFTHDRCILTGTDLAAWLTIEIPAQGDDFAFALPRVKNMVKVCRRFDGELDLEVTEHGTGSSKTSTGCMRCGFRGGEFDAVSSDLYPDRPKPETGNIFTVHADHLLNRIERIKYAAKRPGQAAGEMNARIQFSGRRIFCLDGCRAAWDDTQTQPVPEPFMVPAASLEHLKWFGDQNITVQIDKRYMHITNDAVTLHIRLVDGDVFNLQCAIPERFHEEFFVSTKEFADELTYLKEFIPNTRQPVVYFSNGELFMIVNGCKYHTRITVEGRSEIKIAFDLRYMMDALRQFKSEAFVKLQVSNSISPFLLTAPGRNDCAMVLPVHWNMVAAA